MIYVKTFEEFGCGQSVSGNSTDITSFGQGTPNGMSGTFDKTMAWDNFDSPLQNDVKKTARDMNPDNKINRRNKKLKRIKSYKIHGKVKHIKNN